MKEVPEKVKLIRLETEAFIKGYNAFKGIKWKTNIELAASLGYKSVASITEIIKRRQNIDIDKYNLFKDKYNLTESFDHSVVDEFTKQTKANNLLEEPTPIYMQNNPLFNEMIQSIIRTNDVLTRSQEIFTRSQEVLLNQIDDLQGRLSNYEHGKKREAS